MRKNSTELSMFNVALMFVSAIMGAGFASGREIWQFFGVFGKLGFVGIGFVALLFTLTGLMTAYIALKLNTADMGKIIVPGDNHLIGNFISYFMAAMLFTVLVTMTAAGGAMFNQQFGIPVPIGGIIIALLVIATVLGDFERISKVFKFFMPLLFGAVIVIAIVVNFWNFKPSGIEAEPEPSPVAANWILGATLYISYNMMSIIAFVAKSAINAKSKKSAMWGAAMGGIMLGLMAIVIVLALHREQGYTQVTDMPMLGYAMRISPLLGTLYMILLFAAVYSSATSNFYSSTTKIKEGPGKKKKIVVLALLAYVLGLFGFKNVVAYMFPAEGYMGFLVIGFITVNFFKIWKAERRKTNDGLQSIKGENSGRSS